MNIVDVEHCTTLFSCFFSQKVCLKQNLNCHCVWTSVYINYLIKLHIFRIAYISEVSQHTKISGPTLNDSCCPCHGHWRDHHFCSVVGTRPLWWASH